MSSSNYNSHKKKNKNTNKNKSEYFHQLCHAMQYFPVQLEMSLLLL